ncbi:Hypothetical predicted protein [Mytilus galloprovincialis]|uniref:Plastocyanin-like domain-containing protein n=1 Tax=Mytilus galloprovincialis TaxID=29158 RepID=A0A8B6EMS6_MYTGA|nr:Hypothetical predicted protein [Mytilus galloprovincialis]
MPNKRNAIGSPSRAMERRRKTAKQDRRTEMQNKEIPQKKDGAGRRRTAKKTQGRGVHKDFFLMMMNWFEQDSWYFNQSISLAMMNGKMVDKENDMLREVNTLRAINGRVFGNIGGFDMCVRDRVSWHVLGFGERFDYQNPVFEGNNVQYDGRMVDHVTVYPGTSQTVLMIPDNPGKWLLHAGQLESQTDGMVARYNVYTCNRPLSVSRPLSVPVSVFEKTVIRRYYIAAVDVIWDYAPRKINIVTMGDLRDPNT